MPKDRSDIRGSLLKAVFWGRGSPVSTIAERFKLTPQAVQHHARNLVRAGFLESTGTTRWRRYRLKRLEEQQKIFPVSQGLTEDRIWDQFLRERVATLGALDKNILNYGATEMINNIIDHAGATELQAHYWRTAISITLRVTDNGIGIFQKIASALRLSDRRQALLELGKGKFTTDPQRHTGEGVFFTSRAFDRFSIRSSDLLFTRKAISEDWLVEADEQPFTGTRVTMSLLLPTRRKLEDVFTRYSSGPDDYRFAKTHVPLRLARFGDESLVSRSSAKRVLARIERFDEALLDFKGVASIGPGFADEIFRVFARQHPKIQLVSINANEQVTAMIRRAQHSSPG